MKTRTRFAVAATLGLGMTGLISGCGSGNQQLDDIRADLTPELETLYERQADMDNQGAITLDENGRMFVEDFGRFWLMNHPSRLTPEPVPRP